MLPAHDPANAYRFATYDAADAIATANQRDDPDWSYGVQRLPDGKFVVTVHAGEADDNVFLGYL